MWPCGLLCVVYCDSFALLLFVLMLVFYCFLLLACGLLGFVSADLLPPLVFTDYTFAGHRLCVV